MKLNIHALCTIDSIRDGRQWRMGTGFVFLRRNWLVTAKHVVFDESTQQLRAPQFVVATDPNVEGKLLEVERYHLHPYHDLAVLEVAGDICLRPFYPAHLETKQHERLTCIGFSPSSSSFGKINFNALAIEKYKIERRERDSGVEELIEFEYKGTEGGNSGGPIFSEGAGVVAVISHGVQGTNPNEFSSVRATSIRTIIETIDVQLNWKTV